MPRTIKVDTPGCPPLRALSFDTLGLIKVIESRTKDGGVAKIVERWGDPICSKSIVAASFDDRKSNPLLAVARRNGSIEVLNPLNGELRLSVSVSEAETSPCDDPLVGLHLFRKQRSGTSSRSCSLLACTSKGKASLRRVECSGSHTDTASSDTPKVWSVCGSGSICCCKVSGNESHSVFAGKGVEVNLWDFEKTSKIWSAKSPRANRLGIFEPTWFTSVTFLNKEDHRKIVAGTSNHQVRLYDASAQRRPVLSVDFRDTPIKAIAEDLDGHTIYIGNGSGDMASVDIRTGKLLGCFLGKCSGSIRCIARHPEYPVIASCGLDSYVRFWDVNSRELLSAIFLKQPLTNVVFDSNFSEEVKTPIAESTINAVQNEVEVDEEQLSEIEDDAPLMKRKKARKESKKLKSKKKAKKAKSDACGDES